MELSKWMLFSLACLCTVSVTLTGGPSDGEDEGGTSPNQPAVKQVDVPFNLHQCVWVAINLIEDGTAGPIKSCSFKKQSDTSLLRVAWHGSLKLNDAWRTGTTRHVCRRWFFTINGQECSSPAPIDGMLFAHSTWKTITNEYRPANVEGLCGDIPAGPVKVTFQSGACKPENSSPWPGPYNLGHAVTGWQTTSRISLQEMSATNSDGSPVIEFNP